VQLRPDAHGAQVLFAQTDLNDPLGTHETVGRLWQQTDFDMVLLTAGVLPKSETRHSDPGAAVSAAMVNFVGQLAIGTHALRRFDERGSGYLVVVSSVAAERIRPDNYLYGATKAGLDNWAVGAAHARRNSPVRVMVVRPGMVRTRMSEGMKEIPFTTDAKDVAACIVSNLRRKSVTVWSPPILRFVMIVLRLLPTRIFFMLASRSQRR
jgi:decaprenylphospho-beta-D-erythro-pentofuranosid-2-ulose 2-reductase